MAVSQSNNSEKRKRPGSKKSKSRTVVSVSSSESDSDVSETKSIKPKEVNEEVAPAKSPKPIKKSKKAKSSKPAPAPAQEEDEDTHMSDGEAVPVSTISAKAPSNPPSKESEDFASIYLRKVTVELADDLDKVREANDFKSSSIPMLIHALKQGGSMYSAEEKKRVVAAAGS